jgi:Fe-S cluster assembly protein SufD
MKFINLVKDIKNEEVFKISESSEFFILGLEGGNLDVVFDLVQENISANIYVLILGDGNAEFKIKTKTIHSKPNSSSRVLIKGIFADQSRLDFEGMINIASKAIGSDAYLQNDNLVLSNDAIVNSSPQLEIANDDVKASHGVTISTIDDLQKFYLTSRGLLPELSENLLIKGFAVEVIEKIQDDRIMDLVSSFFKKYD